MASKRNFKKNLNKVIFEAMEDCYLVQLKDDSKKDVTDKLMTDIIAFRNGIRGKIHSAKNGKDFQPIQAEAEAWKGLWASK